MSYLMIIDDDVPPCSKGMFWLAPGSPPRLNPSS